MKRIIKNGLCKVNFACLTFSHFHTSPSRNSTSHNDCRLKFHKNNAMKRANFADSSLAFGHRTTSELLRAFGVLYACSIEPLVANSYNLLHWGERILGSSFLRLLVSPFYRQFVVGNMDDDMIEAAFVLDNVGIGLMIAPMLETDIGNSQRMASKRKVEEHSRPICQTKITAHLNADVMLNISKVYNFLSLQSKIDCVKIISEFLKLQNLEDNLVKNEQFAKYHTELAKFGFQEKDLLQLQMAIPRFYQIGDLSKRKGVILAVDAEYTYLNPCISLIALAMMVVFNTEKSVVWNTYQAYLKKTHKQMEEDQTMIWRQNVHFGGKVVRGAYLERERHLARKNSMTDPTQPSYGHTNQAYDNIISKMLSTVSRSDLCGLLIATHNEDSVLNATKQMWENDIPKDSPKVLIAQIYGMAENISVPLALSGYNVYKSVPFGNVIEVLPYLSRRALENRAVFKGARKERSLLAEELKNRLLKACTRS